MDQLPSRRLITTSILTGLGGASLSMRAGPATAAVPAQSTGLNVRDFGAMGDGTTDDTGAARQAIASAGGDVVYFPSGTYLLNNLSVSGSADLLLSHNAVLKHQGGDGVGPMIGFSGDYLRIRGGVLDGNRGEQTGRPPLISGPLQKGKQVILDGVHARNYVRAAILVHSFGGYVEVQHCLFTGQAEHDGIAGHSTAIVNVNTGEAGAKGLLRFNHNRAVGTDAPHAAGSNPGGVFFAPGTTPTEGTLATIEAVGNHFWGYGQNHAGNVIAALHTYPAVAGARYIGNYFESCSFAAISAKSVQDFVCIGNVITNGQVSSANIAREGAINYAPSYHAGSNSRPRAVIQDNVVAAPGGQPGKVQNGISIMGSSTSIARAVIVSSNVLDGCGMGILANNCADLMIDSNIITNTFEGSVGEVGGIRLDLMRGPATLRANRLVCSAGSAIAAMTDVAQCRLTISDNSITSTASGVYAVLLRGVKSAHLTGNEIDAVSHALTVRADGVRRVNGYYFDNSNLIHSGQCYPVFTDIDSCFGEHAYTGSPIDRQVSPGQVGTRYTQLNGLNGQVLWISTGKTSKDWACLRTDSGAPT